MDGRFYMLDVGTSETCSTIILIEMRVHASFRTLLDIVGIVLNHHAGDLAGYEFSLTTTRSDKVCCT